MLSELSQPQPNPININPMHDHTNFHSSHWKVCVVWVVGVGGRQTTGGNASAAATQGAGRQSRAGRGGWGPANGDPWFLGGDWNAAPIQATVRELRNLFPALFIDIS